MSDFQRIPAALSSNYDTCNPHFPHRYPHKKFLQFTRFLRNFHIIHRQVFTIFSTFLQNGFPCRNGCDPASYVLLLVQSGFWRDTMVSDNFCQMSFSSIIHI